MARKKDSPNRVDKYNHSGFNRLEGENFREEEGDNFLSDFEKYAEGLRVLGSMGFTLIPHPNPDIVGHRVYREVSFELISKDMGLIKDINPPKQFTWRKRVNMSEDPISLSTAYNTIRSECGKAVADFWKPLVDLGGDRRKAIFNLASLFIDASKNNKGRPSENLISLTGGNGGLYVVPQKSWFDERFDSITIEDLLYLFPPAEAKMLQLIIGRILVGRGGTKTIEGIPIEHKARYMGIIVGEPRLGKSTLLDALSDALDTLGYETITIQESSGRFGWADIASSHFAYIDDLTKDIQRRLITSGKIKQLISNNVLKTENKGERAIDTQSQTVILASSNSFNHRDFYNADSGIQDRIKILEIKTRIELCQDKNLPYKVDDENPFNTYRHWSFLAERANVSYDSLIYWLLYLCVQEFLTVNGYEEDIKPFDSSKIKDLSEDEYKELMRSLTPTLKRKNVSKLFVFVEELQKHFRIQTMTNATQSLIYFWRFCIVLFTYNVEKDTPFPSKEFEVNNLINFLKAHQAFYSPEFTPIKELLREDYIQNNSPHWHPYSVFLEINGGSINLAILRCLEAVNLYHPPAKLIDICLSFFTSTKGFELRKDLPIIIESYCLASSYDSHYKEFARFLFYNYPDLYIIVNKAKKEIQSKH